MRSLVQVQDGPFVFGGLAQLVERLLCKQDVSGSSPLTSIQHLWGRELLNHRSNSVGDLETLEGSNREDLLQRGVQHPFIPIT